MTVRRHLALVSDHVFHIQPRRSGITEAEAINMFHGLVAGVKR